MEQVAASSEQQSASTQEIAAAAGSLASAAERLARLVANLKLGDAAPAAPVQTPEHPVPAPTRVPTSLAAIGGALVPRAGEPVPA
jgi:hypothetical protein